jgi:DNA (cytosine-5)-methyltransferase 1
MQGFEADWTLPAVKATRRGHRWKLVGNAVTVDVAHWIGRRLRAPGPIVVNVGQRLVPGAAWPKAAWNVGDGRFQVEASEWPVRSRCKALHLFLKYEPEPLSVRATAGFLKRTTVSSLRFPEGFLAKVRHHLAQMEEAASPLAPTPKGPRITPQYTPTSFRPA